MAELMMALYCLLGVYVARPQEQLEESSETADESRVSTSRITSCLSQASSHVLMIDHMTG